MADDEVHQGMSVAIRAQEALDTARAEATGTELRKISTKTTGLLDTLKQTLSSMADMKRSAKYCESIDKLQSEAELPRFVIGVLGDTGTGKSSLINAVLDEERVVPTNCMRACTAVITEISWNTSNDDSKKYRAEIHFLSQAEWSTEVTALHRDILGNNGNLSEDIRVADSEAQNAYTVLKAVYPTHTDQQLVNADPYVLANFSKIREVIGTVQVVEEKGSDNFYKKIQSFVDSEEKGKGQDTTMAYWPLIKSVRVFLKSEVLSTGVVLVDLPGGRDANAARAAVAANYIKECTRLWVVAPITRAVDDKTAKNLMGHNFKQQLKYDDSYWSITFICTKADDIAVDEAAETLGLRDYILGEEGVEKNMKSRIDALRKDLKKLESKKADLQAQYQIASNDVETWQGICLQAANDGRAFAPFESPNKRKRQAANDARKKLKTDDESSGTEEISSDESDDEAPSQEDDLRKPLSAEEANAKLQELKVAKKTLKEEKKQTISRIKDHKATIKNLTGQRLKIKTERYARCIQGRNEYSRREIQKDFAAGIKELDDELLAEGQEQQEDTERPSYEEIGRALPVFCISSRAFQQLRGRMKRDKRVPGFTSLDETEVPALRKHTLEQAAAMQDSWFKHQLSEVCRFLRGMDLFLAGDDAFLKLSDAEKKEEYEFLEKGLAKLGKAVGDSITNSMVECQEAVDAVLQRMPQAAANASARALATAKGWGAHHNAGGLRYNTYKATCRRRGVFRGAAGSRDFNEDLLRPMKNATANLWDRAFNNRIPEILDSLARSSTLMIHAFHGNMRGRRFMTENTEMAHEILSKHIGALNETLVLANQHHKLLARDKQRNANRGFYPAVEGALRDTYLECAQVRGIGAFNEMKELMEEEVKAQRASVFHDAANEADDAVNNLLSELEVAVRHDLHLNINTMRQDYTGLVGAVATEADNRDRKMLIPIMMGFYQALLMTLTEPDNNDNCDENVVDNDERGTDDGEDSDGSYHDSD
ncbi:tat pathway signal sequence [Colletotrichum asianum]|uniref:Nuclear GTPase SLIP-GC n=1 Tax=Colletotrichum asianum TaxID=702518 RepID=A0A8H3WCF3_9PEZI|nr:hypothetical protein GQ607_009520 [Colletotrichum asianum]